jgi:hypothetical protein
MSRGSIIPSPFRGSGGCWFERRFWRLFDEVFWIALEGGAENLLAGFENARGALTPPGSVGDL